MVMDDVLPKGARLRVRHTANLHQGGTIHDVTPEVNPELCGLPWLLPTRSVSG